MPIRRITTGRRERTHRLQFETLEPRHVLSATVMISEFMASNSTTLQDGDGESSDWVEIYNATPSQVDLAGWHLTDDANEPTKWAFPSTSQTLLQPGEYLVVFASGQLTDNYVDPGGNLHANFALSSDGEFLALTDAAGSVVHQYSPQFPSQRSDVSYGINENINVLELIGPGSPMTALAPTTGALDAPSAEIAPAWTLPGFNDSAWLAANGPALGYDTGDATPPDIPNGTLLPEGLIGADLTDPEEDGTINGTIFAGGFPGSPAGEEPDKGLDNTTATKWLAFQPTGTYYGFQFSGGEQQVVGAYTITSANDAEDRDPYSWTLSGSNDGVNYSVLDTRTAQNFASRFETRLYEFANTTAYEYYRFDLQTEYGVTGQNQPVAIQVAEFELLPPTVVNFTSLLDLDVTSQWQSTQTSLYQRLEFDVADPAALSSLQLEMRYDDGFVAYLNGVRVASAAAPALPNYQSHATELREESLVLQPQAFNLTPYLDSLTAGTNVLAIHALNISDGSSDLLSIPHLTAIERIDDTIALVYMDAPTPGGPNSVGYAGLVADPTLSVAHGFYSTPFQLTIANTTPGATVYYTTDGSAPTPEGGMEYQAPLAISSTSTIRAQAFREGYLPSLPTTSSYLFVNDIVRQTYQSTIAAGFPTSWGPYSPDYGLDSDLIGQFDAGGNPIGGDLFGGAYASTIKDDLQAIPTLSIVADIDDLFGPTGIYTNSVASGSAWERPVSVEYIDPATGEEFQIDAGLRMHGGAFRNDSLSKKHSMRLVFRGMYQGNTKLDYPLFGDDAATSFDTLVLRMDSNDGYAWSSAGTKAQYARNAFASDSQLALGQPSSHHARVHLYINGVYWGLYTPVERPDDSFAATYFGGDKDNWDAINTGTSNSGDLTAWNTLAALSQNVASASTESAKTAAYMRVLGLNPDGTNNPAYATYLDAENYIDYLLVNFYVGNSDWPHRNWWAVRDRSDESTGFKFITWDAEASLGLGFGDTGVTVNRINVSDGAAIPYSRLRSSLEFRMAFADRVHRAFFNDGPLATSNSVARYQSITDEIADAIVAESARWGDMHRSSPYTPAQWANEVNNVVNWLNARNNVFLGQLQSAGLYPTVEAPTFSQFGGQVTPGYELSISAPAGGIYYTTDGSDPRLPGGTLSPTAQIYTGAPIVINESMTIRARVRSGPVWSAINEAAFVTAAPADETNLRISEIHYNPADQAGLADAQALEFIELLNPSDQPVILDDVQLAEFASTPYSLPAGVILAPGERIVVANDPTAFAATYGDDVRLASVGYASANLSNGGERIVLRGALGQIIQDFTYDDSAPWPAAADGNGSSLELIDPFADAANPTSWRASYYRGGSPGSGGEGPSIAGDANGNDRVDGGDFLAWQRGFGSSQLQASAIDGDADADRDVDSADLAVWGFNYGGAAVAVSLVATTDQSSWAFAESTSESPVFLNLVARSTSDLSGRAPNRADDGRELSQELGERHDRRHSPPAPEQRISESSHRRGADLVDHVFAQSDDLRWATAADMVDTRLASARWRLLD